MSGTATAAEIACALGGARRGARGNWSCRCPCHDDRDPSLSIRDGEDSRLLVRCFAGCDGRDVLAELRRRGLLSDRHRARSNERALDTAEAERRRAEHEALLRAKLEGDTASEGVRAAAARMLWRMRVSLAGSLGEVYLNSRGIALSPWPPTLGFLPPRGEYPPALIAAFGLTTELKPGVLAIPDAAVYAVQLVRLTDAAEKREVNPDGHRAKITIGSPAGAPIAVAAMNDLLGLIIAEGIEEALSAAALWRTGAWASGGTTNLPGLARAVPAWIDTVTILVDPGEQAQKYTDELASKLAARGVHAEMRPAAVLGFVSVSAMDRASDPNWDRHPDPALQRPPGPEVGRPVDESAMARWRAAIARHLGLPAGAPVDWIGERCPVPIDEEEGGGA
jgi:hypothetical protein